jgi:hypothetical protein
MLGEDLFSIPLQKGLAVIINPAMRIFRANTALGYILESSKGYLYIQDCEY